MATGSPGRNDSCPCGSGRKFKHCCLAKQDAADAARLRVRAAEGRVVPAILDYALATWGDLLVAHAWEDFWLYDVVPVDMPAEPEFDAMFTAWFTLGFVPDPECPERAPDWPLEPLGLHWLASLGGEVEAMDRAFVLQACHSPLSVFAVEQATPGQSMDLKDILTGRSFHTRELTASRSLRTGDIVFTRVVTLNDVSLLFGMAPYAAPPAWHLQILDWRDRRFRKRPPTRALVAEFDSEIRDLYLQVREAVRDPRPPVVTNSDGDLLRDVTLTYALDLPVPAAYELLLPLASLGSERFDDRVQRDGAGVVTSAELVWMNRTGKPPRSKAPATVLGVMTLSPGRLVVEVNSERRAQAIARQILSRFGEEARSMGRQVSDPVAEAHAEVVARKGLRLVEPASATDPPIAAAEAELRRRYSQTWLDTPVPALKGKTPRQAARSAAGRERLEALLLGFERGSAAGQDDEIAFLRTALKLPQL